MQSHDAFIKMLDSSQEKINIFLMKTLYKLKAGTNLEQIQTYHYKI